MITELHHGDCCEIMPTLPDQSIDLILCDLPFALTANAWDCLIDFPTLWREYKRLRKPNGIIALHASQPFTSLLVVSNLKEFKCEWIWHKNRGSNFANTKHQPMKEHESVCIFYARRGTYNPQLEKRRGRGAERITKPRIRNQESKNYRDFREAYREISTVHRVPGSVQAFAVETGLHPTQKPRELAEYFIETYSHPGDTVMDNCMGSGTTGHAAYLHQRNFIGIERDAEYFAIATKRLRDAQVQATLFSPERIDNAEKQLCLNER